MHVHREFPSSNPLVDACLANNPEAVRKAIVGGSICDAYAIEAGIKNGDPQILQLILVREGKNQLPLLSQDTHDFLALLLIKMQRTQIATMLVENGMRVSEKSMMVIQEEISLLPNNSKLMQIQQIFSMSRERAELATRARLLQAIR